MKASYEEVVMLATRMQLSMIRELTKEENMMKQTWLECKDIYLLDKLKTNIDNLYNAVEKYNIKSIMKHTTDIANYAAMIADKYQKFLVK